MKNKEIYENIIELLKQGLSFYSDSNNYSLNKDESECNIIKDNGNQANFVLDQIKKIEENLKKTEKEYDELLKHYEEDLIKNNTEFLKKYKQ